MSYLRTRHEPIDPVKRRLKDFLAQPQGKRQLYWASPTKGEGLKLVIKERKLTINHQPYYYLSVRAVTFGAPNFRWSGCSYSVVGEECYTLDHAEEAVRAFISRKHAQDPKEPVGTGMGRAALIQHVLTQQSAAT